MRSFVAFLRGIDVDGTGIVRMDVRPLLT